jgi:hypothetical protein
MLSGTEWGPKKNKRVSFLEPFHAAEQRSKKQKNNSAERSDFPRCLLFCKLRRVAVGQVMGSLFFWFVFFGQAKKMNDK